jgi:hypothetical protein
MTFSLLDHFDVVRQIGPAGKLLPRAVGAVVGFVPVALREGK